MTSCSSRLAALAAVRWGFLGSSCGSDSFRDGVESRGLISHYDVSTEEHNRRDPVCSDARLVLKTSRTWTGGQRDGSDPVRSGLQLIDRRTRVIRLSNV